jgi:hypothetical protein
MEKKSGGSLMVENGSLRISEKASRISISKFDVGVDGGWDWPELFALLVILGCHPRHLEPVSKGKLPYREAISFGRDAGESEHELTCGKSR